MGLQLFSNRKWKEDSFNNINVKSVLRNARERAYSWTLFTKGRSQNYRGSVCLKSVK